LHNWKVVQIIVVVVIVVIVVVDVRLSWIVWQRFVGSLTPPTKMFDYGDINFGRSIKFLI
jgi:hypothetical protein